MANNVTRMPRGRAAVPAQAAVPGQQWVGPSPQWWGGGWDGCCDDGGGQIPGCPPGFPPPGCPPWFSGANSPPWYPGANAGVSFGQTPPANPVRGHFWWDGVTLWMFDGAAWVESSGGAGGTPPQSTAPANPSPGQQWFNGSTLFIWDGNAWVPVSQTKTYVQATAPPAPNPGDMWYNGTQMFVWSGSNWAVVGPGAFVGPVGTTTLALRLTVASNLTIPTGPWAIMVPPAPPTIDIMGGWNSTTHQYTPNKAGNYFCATRSIFEMIGTYNSSGHALVKNDSGTFTQGSQVNVTMAAMGISGAPTSESVYLSNSGMVNMNGTSDFLRMWVYDQSGTFLAMGVTPVLDIWLMP